MSRYLPIFLGVLLIVGFTIPQVIMTDRLSGSNVSAEQMAELLKNVPKLIGNDWHGEDMAVEELVREKAGAVGAVSRTYRNVRTGEKVDLWLIVGHARVITGHTPDVCYPSSGFETRAAENSIYPMALSGQPDATFLTNTFFKEDVGGRHLVRVFWSWYDSEADSDRTNVEWEGPPNARWYFGNSRALYKMYFTSEMHDQMETAEESACVRFAREFLPAVNKALAEVHGEAKPGDAAAVAETTSAEPATTEADAESDADAAPADASEAAESESAKDEPATPMAEPLDDLFGAEEAEKKD